jgi:hypothetical protein
MGAFWVVVKDQLSVRGSYLPPVFNPGREDPLPPHTTMRFPVQTAV